MRGAPQRGFAIAMRVTRAWINGVDGRTTSARAAREAGPVLAKATPLPPQDGVRVTITRDCLHPAQTLASPTQKSRSVVRSLGRVVVRL
jgi:hypothetical protein